MLFSFTSQSWDKELENFAVTTVPPKMKIPGEMREHIFCLKNNRLERYDETQNAKEQGTLCYIPSVKYEIECTEVVTELEQYPAGLQAKVCLDVQIVFPNSRSDSGFGEWLSKHNISQLSKDDFKKMLMAENDIGFPQYLQSVMQEEARTGCIPLIMAHGADSINNEAWLGQALSVKWLKVTNVCRIQLTPLLTEEEKIAQEYQKRESEKNRETVEFINDIERAKDEAIAQKQAENAIQAEEDQGKIAAAKADAEIKLSQEEVEHQKKMDTLEQEGVRLENLKKEEEKKLAEAKTEAERAASQKQLEILNNKNELLSLQIEAESEKSQKQLELLDAQKEQVRSQTEAEREERKALLPYEIKKRELEIQLLEQNLLNGANMTEILKEQLRINEQNKAEAFYEIPSNDLISIVKAQSRRLNVRIRKVDAVEREKPVLSREPGLVKINVKQDEVEIGKDLAIEFESCLSGFVTLLCFGSSCLPKNGSGVENVYVLSPNILVDAYRIEAETPYTFPGEELAPGYRAEQMGPAGVERILAIVTPEPLLDIPDGVEDFVKLKPAGWQALWNKLKNMEEDSWSAGYISYRVIE